LCQRRNGLKPEKELLEDPCVSDQFFSPLLALGGGQTATEQVFQSLYDAIISLKLPPGAKVSETEVAKQLDVSRQPVRDAFFRLSNLGFLAIKPQRATLITKISERAVCDAVFIRTALEVECLRRAINRIDGRAIAELQANIERQQAALDHSDAALFHGSDEAFHAMICKFAGQPHAWRLIQEQKAHMDRVRYLTLSTDRRRVVMAEHTAIMDAVIEGNEQNAEAALREHLGSFTTVLDQVRDAHAQYFECDL